MSTASASTPQPAQPREAHDEEPLSPSKTPVANGVLPLLGVIWALALGALGVLLVREALVHAALIDGRKWVDKSVSFFDGQSAEDWMFIVGVLLVLVGLVLLVVAFRPRRRKELALEAQTGVFLTTGSVRRIAESAASDVDGVDTTSVRASRTKVSVDATTLSSDTDDARSRIEAAVQDALSAVQKPPTVKAEVRSTGGSS